MFISKRKWEEMCDRIEGLDETNNTLRAMINNLGSGRNEIHEETRRIKLFIEALNTKVERQNYELRRDACKGVSTKEISDITLEELARLVIDGTPITRKVMEENIKEYGRME